MKRWTIGLAAVVAVLVLGACQSQERAGDVTSGPGGPGAVKLSMIDTEFEPTHLELEAGSEVEIQVANDGDGVHNFTIEDLDLSTGTMESGDVMTATLTVPEGTTEFHCTLHSGMDGEIVAT